MQKKSLRVDVDLSFDQIQKWTSADAVCQDVKVTGVCLDSRSIHKGDLFIAIKAARDGHEFAKMALEKGAAAVLVDHDMGLENQIIVQDTLEALFSIAKNFRLDWDKTIIGVSGSNGKTTTKEILQVLFGDQAFCTPGTWNNHLGIPLSLLMLRDTHRFGILEMGINDYGDLRGYCAYAKPDMGVLTVIGDSHLMNLQNREGVAKAKRELFEAIPENGSAVIFVDDPHIRAMAEDLTCKKITTSIVSSADVSLQRIDTDRIEVKYGDTEFESVFSLVGDHNLSNLACSLGVAYASGLEASFVKARIPMIKPLDMRMQKVTIENDISVIVDCYNANPTSTRAGLQTLVGIDQRKVLLLGDMLELGEASSSLHLEMGKTLQRLSPGHVFFTGQFAKDYYQGALLGGIAEADITILEDRVVAHEKIRAQLKSGDILYVKGSRGVKLEELIAPLL